MTAGSAPARATAPFLPRVLRVAEAAASPDDARVVFALTLRRDADGGFPLVELASDRELPPPGDRRWCSAAFAAPAARAQDRRLFVRRATLAQAAARGGSPLAAALEQALAAWLLPARAWRIAGRELPLRAARPSVLGVVNVTPDSFSDGGRFFSQGRPAASERAIAHGEALLAAGAAIVDVGGESTRPGSSPVTLEQELDRALPVVEGLARRIDAPISIDTTKAEVARVALAAGASIVNDTSALEDPDMAGVVAAAGAGVVLMHRLAPPRTMQDDPRYVDCPAEVAEALAARAEVALASGIAPASIVLDPGIGFGKRLGDNLALIDAIGSLRSLGFPVLLGASRKGFLGALTGRAAAERDAATLATTAAAAARGCELVRVHDVAGTVDLLRVLAAVAELGERAP